MSQEELVRADAGSKKRHGRKEFDAIAQMVGVTRAGVAHVVMNERRFERLVLVMFCELIGVANHQITRAQSGEALNRDLTYLCY